MTPTQHVTALLERTGFTFTSEVDLQDGLARALEAEGIGFDREVQLTARDRIDFLTHHALGIEVKTAGSWPAVLAQCQRYAASQHVDALLIVTSKATHLGIPADHIGGKPLAVHFVGGRRM